MNKTTLDVRRPVINDMSELSGAIATLNNSTEAANLPPKIVYGEIIYNKVNLGVLTAVYSAFDDEHWNFGEQLSAAAEAFILGPGNTPATFTGDGLIPGERQHFTTTSGFPAPGYPPADPPATDQNTIWRLQVRDRDVVHTDAPLQVNDILSRLRLIVPSWFP